MTDEEPIIRVTAARVLALALTCGHCEEEFEIDDIALDEDGGQINPAHDFMPCPHCGAAYDGSAVRFYAHTDGESAR